MPRIDTKIVISEEDLRLGLSTTLTSEDKNGDFETSLKVKNKDYILMYDGLGAKIENISTNEVTYPINHYFALWMLLSFLLSEKTYGAS